MISPEYKGKAVTASECFELSNSSLSMLNSSMELDHSEKYVSLERRFLDYFNVSAVNTITCSLAHYLVSRLSTIAMALSGMRRHRAKCWLLSSLSTGQPNYQARLVFATWQLCNFKLCRFYASILGGILAQKFGTKHVFGWEIKFDLFTRIRFITFMKF